MTDAKFVQIAVGTEEGEFKLDNVYALDAAGIVWLYDWVKCRWSPLDATRSEAAHG